MIHDSRSIPGRKWSSIVMVALMITAGCGSDNPVTFPVNGKVTYPDGLTVSAGMIELQPVPSKGLAESKRYNARGVIRADGTYCLTTFVDGDGATPGRHRVIVQEPYPNVDEGETKGPPVINAKYRRYRTSGLEIDVKEEQNEITIVVTRP